ncbi:uncharacterized protein BX663DRAFT_490322 [Cokeromyces recurvatus]|uniref:uncharacterized protein n=1 Tax=Cokeromyces recurvatus TaxID=90255 RepID=UPI00221F908A|nr:uncharacterized protein BX663DRAFT_490322 [Cokeromyces recurvatus]KAI7898185.1 hypothetical protein BX663DRAFT_490322 [Cokeromyces recurvatus]
MNLIKDSINYATTELGIYFVNIAMSYAMMIEGEEEDELPLDLQQVICHYAISSSGDNKFALVALTVNKSWAYFVCRVLYRHYCIKNYLTFVGFVKTITSINTILPYGLFVRSIDLTPVNKYGIDMRAHRLIRCCPNIVKMTLGHPTTLKTETIQDIAKYNTKLHTLSMGGLESFPFMLDCDFSRLRELQHVVLKTTPLLSSAFMTLPKDKLKSIRLIQMDAIKPDELLLFCQLHPNLQLLAIENCKALFTEELGEVLAKLLIPHKYTACSKLRQIELVGRQVTDESLTAFFKNIPQRTQLYKLKLFNTSVTSKFLNSVLYPNSSIQVENLELTK